LVKVGEKKILKETSSKLEEIPVVADKRPASNPPAKSNNQNKKQKKK
jgi:hypothetical protein